MGDTSKHVPAPKPANDEDRVAFLKSLLVLDTEKEPAFDRITESAQKCFRTPIALVSLVDAERQWFKSCLGLDVNETSRDVAFCAHAILPEEPQTLLVPDASKDERFQNSPLVLGPPYIRFYAGAPLVYKTREGAVWKLGTLCVIDQIPRTLREDEIHLLETLARLVVTELELRVTFKQREVRIEQKADLHAKTRAREMNTAYIGQVAHDLRTPLNSFTLGLQALAQNGLDQESLSIIETLQISCELMVITCTKAVDHSMFEAGQDFGSKKSPFDVQSVLRKAQTVVSGYTHESKSVLYEYGIDAGVSKMIISDKDWFWHMVMNFLSNARKFTVEGSVKLRVSIDSSKPDNKMLKVTCTDTGIGLESNQMSKLFTAFSQLQDYAGGTGLGLYSVKKKATALGGYCGVEKNYPNGCIFWFTIPYVPADETDGNTEEVVWRCEQGEAQNLLTTMITQISKNGSFVVDSQGESYDVNKAGMHSPILISRNNHQPSRMPLLTSSIITPTPTVVPETNGEKKRVILLIEDDVPTRKLLSKGLEKQGFQVVQAPNGAEGLALMCARRYHMVLCDIMMPVMDGLECIKRFRAWEANHEDSNERRAKGLQKQFVCAVSANTEKWDVDKALGAGMDKFFPKPIRIPELIKFLEGSWVKLNEDEY